MVGVGVRLGAAATVSVGVRAGIAVLTVGTGSVGKEVVGVQATNKMSSAANHTQTQMGQCRVRF